MGPCLSSRRRPERGGIALTPAILDEFLQALHRGLAGKRYAVIGAAALLKYGHQRQTTNVDVLVTFDAMPVLALALSKRKEFTCTANDFSKFE